MFVALRDLVFARGRFALIGAVIALLTLMVVLLSGLTAGLSRQSISAITDLPADHLVFAQPAGDSSLSFSSSRLDQKTVTAWAQAPGVDSAEPLDIAMSHAEASGAAHDSEAATDTAVAVFAVRSGSDLPPSAVHAGAAVLSGDAAASLGVATGDEVTIGGKTFGVTAVAGDDSYSHTPVVWMTIADASASVPGLGADSATVIALRTGPGADLPATDARLGTKTVTVGDSVTAIGSYSAENGSLQLMRALLLAISALVVGAFFTVWTVQRSADIAVLKALGSSNGYLLRDALGQALALLVVGTGVGTALAAALGALAATAVPFELTLSTVLVPAGAMVGLGLIGAAASLRRVTSVDPLTALAGAR